MVQVNAVWCEERLCESENDFCKLTVTKLYNVLNLWLFCTDFPPSCLLTFHRVVYFSHTNAYHTVTDKSGVPRRQPHHRSGLGDPALCGSHPLVTPSVFLCVCVCGFFAVLSILLLFLGFLYFCCVFPSVLWYCRLGLLTCKTVSQITYTVLMETLNPA